MANLRLYPRTITATRPEGPYDTTTACVGKQPYQGQRRDAEPPVLFEVPASIQYSAPGRGQGANLPSDTPSLSTWRVLTPPGLLERDVLKERDVLTDELGKRYRVDAAYWSPLGYSIRATLLQA